MPKVPRIVTADWMAEPALVAVIEALQTDGGEVRFVGGCVRDTLAKRPINDIDIATPAAPERVMKKLEAAGLKAVPTGLAHGTVTAVSDGQAFEITTLRIDVETDGRHARVDFTDDWRADAARRDLTINALSLAPDGRLYDFFGGQDDLAAGRVRFVGDAARRMAEDWLRALRFFRFHAHYGQGPLDPEGLAAAGQAKAGVAGLSMERVRNELLRLLKAPAPMACLAALADCGLLAVVLPNGFSLSGVAALVAIEAACVRPPDALLRLTGLLTASGDRLRDQGRRLRLSNLQCDEMVTMKRLAGVLAGEAAGTTLALERTLYHHGPAPVERGLLLAAAGQTDP